MSRTVWALIAVALTAGPAVAQDTASLADRLRDRLPARIADQVIQRIEAARAHGLPAAALENRALELLAKGASADAIAHAIDARAAGLATAAAALANAGIIAPTPDEVDAGAAVMARGVDGSNIADLARATPSGQSLAVPLTVVAALIDRGLPADAALNQVRDRLTNRASVAALAQGAATPEAKGRPDNPGAVGLGIAGQASAGAHGQAGPPTAVPAPGGDVPRPVNPTTPKRPTTPGNSPGSSAPVTHP